MKALIIYDSLFGNTQQVAHAMAITLADQADVTALRAGDVTPEHLTGLDLLIVGSPTQAFRPTSAIKKLLGSIPTQRLKGVNYTQLWHR